MGAIAVVLNAGRDQVLLHKREDFRQWALPGGRVEPDESESQAAVRETREETGYEIRITRLVGEYARPQYKDDLYVFEGTVVGGKAIASGPETLAVAWFDIHSLPPRMTPTTKQYIADTLANHASPIQRELHFPVWQIVMRNIALALRNTRNRFRG